MSFHGVPIESDHDDSDELLELRRWITVVVRPHRTNDVLKSVLIERNHVFGFRLIVIVNQGHTLLELVNNGLIGQVHVAVFRQFSRSHTHDRLPRRINSQHR